MSNDSGGTLSALPVPTAATAGVGAWIASYLLTYLLAAARIQDSVFGQLTEIPTWKVVGWVLYNAHFVNTIVDVPLIGGATNAIGSEGGFTALLFAVPPALLLVAGLAVGRRTGVESMPAGQAGVSGAAVAVGYVVPSVVGVFLFGTANVSVDPVTGVLLAGVVYPLVFGAVGALAAGTTA